jgi:hypothetical protein
MKPPASIREYHYWSERLVTKLWQDNISRLPDTIQLSAGISNFSIQSQGQPSPQTRAARAHVIESLLADHTVRDLDYTGPVRWLAGRSPLVLSSLRRTDSSDTGAVTLFADLVTSQGKRIAVCLFGSAHNVCGRDPELPSWRCFGWTSSSSEGVELLLHAAANAENSSDPELFWRQTAMREKADLHEISWNAQNICSGQGMYHGGDFRSWHRGYTIGHYTEVEWLAQIFFTDSAPGTDDDHLPLDPYDVVYVGSALWVRSSGPRTWIPYTATNVPRLDAALLPRGVRSIARLWYKHRGQHRQHFATPKEAAQPSVRSSAND